MVLIGDKERGHRVLFIKLGLLTCVLYVVLMTLLEAGLWALVYFKGFMWYYSGKLRTQIQRLSLFYGSLN